MKKSRNDAELPCRQLDRLDAHGMTVNLTNCGALNDARNGYVNDKQSGDVKQPKQGFNMNQSYIYIYYIYIIYIYIVEYIYILYLGLEEPLKLNTHVGSLCMGRMIF